MRKPLQARRYLRAREEMKSCRVIPGVFFTHLSSFRALDELFCCRPLPATAKEALRSLPSFPLLPETFFLAGLAPW